MPVHNLQHWADETDSSSVDESHTPTAWVRRTQYTPRVHLGLHLKIQCTPRHKRRLWGFRKIKALNPIENAMGFPEKFHVLTVN